jgi:hypothetical protein
MWAKVATPADVVDSFMALLSFVDRLKVGNACPFQHRPGVRHAKLMNTYE